MNYPPNDVQFITGPFAEDLGNYHAQSIMEDCSLEGFITHPALCLLQAESMSVMVKAETTIPDNHVRLMGQLLEIVDFPLIAWGFRLTAN